MLIGGDFNTDLSRINSLHTGALTNFVNQNGYVFGLNCSNVGVEFTYENIATGSRSVIDHIIVSESLSSQVLSYYSIDSVDNMSDHRVLVAELTFEGATRRPCMHVCGTLKCENAAICEKVAKCEKNSTLNVKIDAICEKITLNVKK